VNDLPLPTSCNKSVSGFQWLQRSSSPSFALASALILRTDIQNAVAVNLKGDLDLWLTPRRWRDSAKLELAQQVIVLGTTKPKPR
jgi:hypothetical protein